MFIVSHRAKKTVNILWGGKSFKELKCYTRKHSLNTKIPLVYSKIREDMPSIKGDIQRKGYKF